MKTTLFIVSIVAFLGLMACNSNDGTESYTYTFEFRNYSSHLVTVDIDGEIPFKLNTNGTRKFTYSSAGTVSYSYSPSDLVRAISGTGYCNFYDK